MTITMDEVDRRILELLFANARATVKDIARQVALTAPAVSERIRRLERSGVIEGYTLRLGPGMGEGDIQAIISVYVQPADRDAFARLLKREADVKECYHVTGALSHLMKVRCADIEALDALISRLQKMGQTNTQIVLSTMVSPDTRLPL